MYPRRLTRQSGFTLIELVIVLMVMGVLSVYAAMNNSNPAAYTLRSQAERMASDLRHVQTLATTWGRSLRITVAPGANGSYSVSCVNAGTFPCNSSPVINPVTGSAFTVSLQQGAALAGPTTLDIDSLGKPSAAATYVLSADTATRNVAVAALTGFVTLP
jgi:MSHA pilin protein MshC